MKYYKNIKSAVDKDVEIPTFAINDDELQILRSLLIKSVQNTPRVPDTIPILGRMRNMRKTIEEYIRRG